MAVINHILLVFYLGTRCKYWGVKSQELLFTMSLEKLSDATPITNLQCVFY